MCNDNKYQKRGNLLSLKGRGGGAGSEKSHVQAPMNRLYTCCEGTFVAMKMCEC